MRKGNDVMPRVSAKRQITLPIAHCREAGIGPGDEYRCFVADGRITIVRKEAGAARGFLRHVTGDPGMSDDESLRSALEPSEP
jgi:bifunctional DNA-binding transcriptional regulator/antitoxin component of YhaV-PrlF toxin-antitoxin module